ncbi:MAG: helix-turn-helix transcriptional regulator [Syntrophotaleaceae bacterium]
MEESRLKIARTVLGGISQAKFAKSLGVPSYKIRDMESGKVRTSPDIARKMEELFDFSFRWVMTGRGPMFADSPRTGHEKMESECLEAEVEPGSGCRLTVREGETFWHSDNPDLLEILNLLREYGSPKLLREIKEKLLRVKRAVEED